MCRSCAIVAARQIIWTSSTANGLYFKLNSRLRRRGTTNIRAWFSSIKPSAAGGSKYDGVPDMLLLHQVAAAFLLVTLTMWLECGGIATLITWARRAVAGDIHKLGPFRSAALVVRVTSAVIALHGLQVLVWAG